MSLGPATLPGDWDPVAGQFLTPYVYDPSPAMPMTGAAARARRMLHEASCSLALEKGIATSATELMRQGFLHWRSALGVGPSYKHFTFGTGLGHALIRRALQAVAEQWGAQPVRIGAQARLEAFYASHGFVDANRPYVEDGIDHLEMVWHPLKPGAIG